MQKVWTWLLMVPECKDQHNLVPKFIPYLEKEQDQRVEPLVGETW